MRSGYKKINYEVYPFGLWVFYKMKNQDIYKILDEQLPPDTPREEIEGSYCNPVFSGRTNLFSTGQTTISFNDADVGLVTHEALHATSMLMNTIGIPLSETSEEAWAYMIQYIVDKIHEMFQELSKPKKK